MHRGRAPPPSPGASIAGDGIALEPRLAAIEAAQAARDEEMRRWSDGHARLLELLASEALCG
eukprot:2326270-Prymnesium_polylepis.1